MGNGKSDRLLYNGILCAANPDTPIASLVDAGYKTESGGTGFVLIVELRTSWVGLGDASGAPPSRRYFLTGGTTSTAIAPGFGMVPVLWKSFHSALVSRRIIGV